MIIVVAAGCTGEGGTTETGGARDNTSTTLAGDGAAAGTGADKSLTVTCEVGRPQSFEFTGQVHKLVLVKVQGSSAVFTLTSAPSTLILTKGRLVPVDLSQDTLPDAEVELISCSDHKAEVRLATPALRVWDETSFTAGGGFRPYKHHNNGGDEDFSAVSNGESLDLLYVSEDHKLNWERYLIDGSQMRSPQLLIGVLDPGRGNGRVTSVDAVLVGAGNTGGTSGGGGHDSAGVSAGGGTSADAVGVVTKTNAGLSIRLFWDAFGRSGPALHLGDSLDYPAAAMTDGSLLVAAHGNFDSPRAAGPRPCIILSEVEMDGSLVLARQEAVTTPGDNQRDFCVDMAVDEQTARACILYKRETTNINKQELRLVVVNANTLERVDDIVVGPAAGRGTKPDGCVTAGQGRATIFWSSDAQVDGGPRLHLREVDVLAGTLRTVLDAPAASRSPRTQIIYPCELISVNGDPHVAYYDTQANLSAPSGSADRGRFVLWPVPTHGAPWTESHTTLEGGKPIYADLTFDLNAFAQEPAPAICDAPTVLRGVVTNRGSRDAQQVVVTATRSAVGQLGTVSLGKVDAASAVEFSIPWMVPADYEQETLDVTFTITSAVTEYTADNNVTAFAFTVRQKGLVSGRVQDASSDIRHSTNWYPGLANAVITIGGHTVLSDQSGCFAVDGLDFGTYPVTVTRDGYNSLSSEVRVTRTRPIAYVAADMDNHGVLCLQVVDETGKPLEGVNVVLEEYRCGELTPISGTLVYDMSARTYSFSFIKRGYTAIHSREIEVVLGEDRTEQIAMHEATTATLGGRVVDKRGLPIADATVTIKDASGNVVAQPAMDADGGFTPVELVAKPPKSYTIVVTANGLTVEEDVQLYGGDALSRTILVTPGRGELRLRSATEGYTSWMLKAGWPGIGEVSGADMYVWFGNYAIRVGTEYFQGNDEISAVDVTVWGGAYEVHATQSEFDPGGWAEGYFDDVFGVDDNVFEMTNWSDIPVTLATEHATDIIDLTTGAYDLIGNLVSDGDDDYLITGQGNEVLTWREAQDDIYEEPEWDSSHPLDSAFSVLSAIPTSFAIPVVIGGVSEERTAVRVDRVDVVRVSDDYLVPVEQYPEWTSHAGDTPIDNENGKRYQVATPDVHYDDAVIYVWLEVQKLVSGTLYGTAFDQRQKQVVIFHPDSRKLEAFIASGMYLDHTRIVR